MPLPFDDPTEDDFEFVVLPQGQEPPKDVEPDDDKLIMTREELAKLRTEADDRASVRDLIGTIGQSLKQQQKQPANVALPQDFQTEDEFDREVEDQILANGKTRKVIEKIIDRRLAPVLAHYEKQFSRVQRDIVTADPALGGIMQKYGSEIDEELQKMPSVQRTTREAYEYVANQVRQRHFDDIVAEKVAEALKKQQETVVEGSSVASAKRRPVQEAGRMNGGVTRKTVYLTEQLKDEARHAHMTPEEYARRLERSKE